MCSKPAFREYIRAHFFYCEREFTSIYKKCKRFLASAAMYMRSALLYSTLPNVTVDRRIQKSIFSSTRLLWCGVETFYSNRVITINKKKSMVVVHVCLLVWCCIFYMTSFTSLTSVPLTVYGMCIIFFLSHTKITSHTYGIQYLTPSTYTLCQAC